jgi:hypothetical protein
MEIGSPVVCIPDKGRSSTNALQLILCHVLWITLIGLGVLIFAIAVLRRDIAPRTRSRLDVRFARDATHRLKQCGEIVTNAFEYQRPSSTSPSGAVPARSAVRGSNRE